MSGALTALAVVAIVLTFLVGDVFGYLSIAFSALAFAAILRAYGELGEGRQAPAQTAVIDDDEELEDAADDLDVLDVPEDEPEPEPTADEDEVFPIEDYDVLTAAQILTVLPLLDIDELEIVWDREHAGAGRATVLNRIDQRIAALQRRKRR